MNMHGSRRPGPTAAGLAAAILMGVLATVIPPSAGAQANPDILVSGDWLVEHRDDPGVVVLHVGMASMGRPLEEYVQGAHYIDYHDIALDRNDLITELAPVEDLVEVFRAAGVSDDSHVVVVGDPGLHAARVFMTLDYLGHGDRTSVLDGGLAAWKAVGGGIAAEPATPTRGDFEADVREDMLVTAEWIQDRLEDPNVTLIDARPENEYTGERPGRDFLRGGHIPGAYNLYWQDLTGEDVPRLIDLDEVKARFDEAGASTDGVVVSYCLIGMRASYTYMISRYLGYETKFYDASWNDWGRREDLPLVTGRDRR
ncbi:sulfurtransferase [Candidatus Palauibacter sp.]|uniref:sulfurtransferase n=1 Tax=Candidatus Palauibacter sp. TaxID=3101350 RepID=UPI003B51FB19